MWGHVRCPRNPDLLVLKSILNGTPFLKEPQVEDDPLCHFLFPKRANSLSPGKNQRYFRMVVKGPVPLGKKKGDQRVMITTPARQPPAQE